MSIARSIAIAVLFAGLCACERPSVPSGHPVGAGEYDPSMEAAATKIPSAFVRANSSTPLQAVTTCNMERVGKESFADAPITVAAASAFRVGGYLYDAGHEVVPQDARLRAVAADGTVLEAPLRGRIDRPDVPEYFGIGAWARRSGFDVLLPAGSLPPGEYRLLLTFAHGTTLYACDNGRRLRVGP
jgi:hypothetical protein